MTKNKLILVLASALALLVSCGQEPSQTKESTTSEAVVATTPAVSAAQPTPYGVAVIPATPESTATPADLSFCKDSGPDPIVALVDNRIRIPFSQVYALVADNEKRLVDVAGAAGEEFDRSVIINKNRLDALHRLVEQQRRYLEAMRRNIDPLPEEINFQLERIVSSYTVKELQALDRRLRTGEITEDERNRQKAQIIESAIDGMLEQTGWSREQFDDQVKKAAMVTKMMDEQVYNNIVPSTDEMKLFYEQNRTTFCMTPARADIHRVEMHKNENRTLEETRQEIEKVHADVAAAIQGATPQEMIRRFMEFIRKYSDGPDALGGGYVIIYGTEPRGTLEQATIDMAYASDPYQLSPIFEIYNGYSFLILKQIYPRIQRTFDEMKSSIEMEIIKKNQEARTQAFLNEITNRYPVAICLENLYVAKETASATSAVESN